MIIEWLEGELSAATPPENLTVTEWSCKYRELGKLSAITGLYNIDITPFFRPALDRCGSPLVDEQNICAAAQIGKTVAFLENVDGYYTHQEPSDILNVLADEDTAKYVCVDKVAAMFKDSAGLEHLYDKPRFKLDEIKAKNGGHIDFAWASSVSKLATKPKRIVILDEVNKPGYNLKSQEASSISLAHERTESFPRGYFKHIHISTPTLEKGNISILAVTADICYDWHCKCPFCGTLQPLRWSAKYCHGFVEYKYRGKDGEYYDFGRVVWEGGRLATREQIEDTARYECGTCNESWTTEQKNDAVRNGEEVPRTEPTGRERKHWNHYPRLLSLMDAGDLAVLVDKFVTCFKIPGEKMVKALQGFVNSTLAEPFKQVIKTNEQTTILQARTGLAPQTVPEQAVALTCYVDVQKYGFWFAVRAWAQDSTSWLIHYGKLALWSDVEALLFDNEYTVENRGFPMRIWRAGVDTGGGQKYENMSMTEETYQWIRANGIGRGCRVFACKGVDGRKMQNMVQAGSVLDKLPSGKPLIGGLQIVKLNPDMLKEAFHYRIEQAATGENNMSMFLHSGVGEDYARQVTAEELQLNESGGQEWVAVRRDNHLLDCECGNIALASPEFLGGGVNLLAPPAPPKAPRRKGGKKPTPGSYNSPAWLNS